MSKLKISDDLSLPLDAVTQKFAILGRTGSGKSYGATKLCEEMLDAKAQVVALDPVGVWWGLRTGTAAGDGYNIPVFGGIHGDIPLEPEAGAMMADLIVERNLSAVLDLSNFLLAEQRRFATAFAIQLFHRKKTQRSPLHVFFEEAQEFVPQKVGKESAKMVGAFERLIKLGRNFGIGATLISQRPQAVNKDVLNQTECLLAFQMTGPHERKSIEGWIAEKGVNENIANILPHLKIGECHLWSPQWLQITRQVKIAKKKTADVSSTPKPGMKAVEPQELKPVELEELREKMAATIERAKAEDPRELQRELADVKRRLANMVQREEAALKLQQKAADSKPVTAEPLLTAREKEQLANAQQWIDKGFELRMNAGLAKLQASIDTAIAIAKELAPIVAKYAIMQKPVPEMHKGSQTLVQHPRPEKPAAAAPRGDGAGEIGGGIRRMMIALAQRPGLNSKQLGVRASMSSNSGTFGTYLAKMRTNGWLEGTGRDSMWLTPAGVAALGEYTPLPEGQALLDHWLTDLGQGSGAARMLQALANAYPQALTKEQLGTAANISHSSGTFGTYLSKLRTLELITGSKELQASAELFG
jgi:hypothetical protein